jgi:hypothetical protein
MQAAHHPTHDFRRAETSADFRHGQRRPMLIIFASAFLRRILTFFAKFCNFLSFFENFAKFFIFLQNFAKNCKSLQNVAKVCKILQNPAPARRPKGRDFAGN